MQNGTTFHYFLEVAVIVVGSLFHSVLYRQGKYVFERNYGIYKRFIDVFYILTSAWKKKQNMPHFEIDFMLNFAMFPADLTCVNGSTIKLVLRKLLLRINLWVSE